MLTNKEKLEEKAYNDNIKIVDFHISETKKSSCYWNNDIKAISLDRQFITSTAEETELLAEEIGHFETGSLYSLSKNYNSKVERQNRLICEARAKKWAIQRLLPPCVILKGLYSGVNSPAELAEYCDVTVDFLIKAIDYYKTQDILFGVIECL